MANYRNGTGSKNGNGGGKSGFAINGTTIVMLGVIICGWVANYSITQNQVTSLQNESKDFIRRSEHIELQRRIDSLEHELVPRSETLIREEQLNKRLDFMQDTMKNIQSDLSQIKIDLRKH